MTLSRSKIFSLHFFHWVLFLCVGYFTFQSLMRECIFRLSLPVPVPLPFGLKTECKWVQLIPCQDKMSIWKNMHAKWNKCTSQWKWKEWLHFVIWVTFRRWVLHWSLKLMHRQQQFINLTVHLSCFPFYHACHLSAHKIKWLKLKLTRGTNFTKFSFFFRKFHLRSSGFHFEASPGIFYISYLRTHLSDRSDVMDFILD